MTASAKRIRSAGVVVHENALLTMFRRRHGREYYTLPGGAIESGETPAVAAVREICEETNIIAVPDRLLYELVRTGTNMDEYFFLCTYISGSIALGSESIEYQIQDAVHNYFEPRWLPVAEIDHVDLLPHEVTVRLMQDLEHGFSHETQTIAGAPLGEGGASF